MSSSNVINVEALKTPEHHESISLLEILCIFQKCNQIAAASYNISNSQISIFESIDCYQPDFMPVEPLLSHLNPRLILYNKNSHHGLINIFQKYGISNNCTLQQLSSNSFNYANCKELIYSTQFTDFPDQYNYLNTIINISNERLVCVIGALIAQLREILPAITSYSGSLNIKCIIPISIENIVWIDNETYNSLQVFDSMTHPSALKWVNKSSKHSYGLSIYAIVEKHCTFLGSSKLRTYLSSPSKDIAILKERQEVINFCIDPKNNKMFKTMKMQLNHLAPVYVIMKNVECANVRGKHWKSIYQNIYYSVLLAETCKEYSKDIQLFQEIGRLLTDEMYAMAYHLDRIIDFEKMEGNELFIVRNGISESLELAKLKFNNLMDAINKVVPYEFDTVPNYIKKIHMLYIPEMKFLLSIPYWKKALTSEELELPGLEYKFSSNKTAYYKSRRCEELDNLLGDPQIEILTEEASIIRALGKYIRKHIPNTYILIDKIAELDCIFALGALAKENDYIKPSLQEKKEISIIDGVHPLLKICCDSTIPNTTESTPERSLIKIIYGANSSGKTIYLKQVALLSYMAHIGSFIPAMEAKIGVLNNIHTYLSSTESVISHSSSFMSDIRKLVSVISSCTSNSLLILDEVGKGTTEINGVAILTSCINYWLSRGAQACPHIFLSTHLSPLQLYIKPRNQLYSINIMDYTTDGEKCIFLYKMKTQDTSYSYFESDFPDIPEFISTTANRVLKAMRSGEGVTPYTQLRLKKCKRFYSFLQKFSMLDTSRAGLIEEIRSGLSFLEN